MGLTSVIKGWLLINWLFSLLYSLQWNKREFYSGSSFSCCIYIINGISRHRGQGSRRSKAELNHQTHHDQIEHLEINYSNSSISTIDSLTDSAGSEASYSESGETNCNQREKARHFQSANNQSLKSGVNRSFFTH